VLFLQTLYRCIPVSNTSILLGQYMSGYEQDEHIIPVSKTSKTPPAPPPRCPPIRHLDGPRATASRTAVPPTRGLSCRRLEGCAALPHCRCSLRALFPARLMPAAATAGCSATASPAWLLKLAGCSALSPIYQPPLPPCTPSAKALLIHGQPLLHVMCCCSR
jgi:hypothetical protein